MKISFSATISIAALATFAFASGIRHVVHEKRNQEPADWFPKTIGVDPSTILPLSIALTQRNLVKGKYFLMDVSDPLNSNYGKHWTSQKVISTLSKLPN
jgi:tripeptidyl-peptidase I